MSEERDWTHAASNSATLSLQTMGVKRKQPDCPPESDGSDYDVVAQDDSDVDIAAALVDGGHGDDDDGSGDEDFIRDTLRKKHVKDGAEVVKQAKGKGKSHVKKGELGGGSFQSMGACD